MSGPVARLAQKIIKKLCKNKLENGQGSAYPVIDLFYWRPQTGVNFGDELGRTVVELMLAERGYTLWDEVPEPRQLLAIGSVLHFSKNDAVLWGTGRNGKEPDESHSFQRLDVRAVRGPRTRDFLRAKGIPVPDIFGDPALLLPALTKGRFKPTAEKPIAFVPNLNDYKEKLYAPLEGLSIINPMQSWNKAIEEILQYKTIVASSLHGLIIAEAFGIPARYVRLTEREGLFKYQDYYEGTGRSLDLFARSLPEAIEMGGAKPLSFDPEKLLASFPYDLWRSQQK